MFRLYYQENSGHGAFLPSIPGQVGTATVPTGGILYQALLDLAQWVEQGTAPLPSTRYRTDAMNQVVVTEPASARAGLQPVVRLTANGGDRAVVKTNQPVDLLGQIEMPPAAGKIVSYDWYLGGDNYKFETATKPASPQVQVNVRRTVSFPAPGEYVVTLRAVGERTGAGSAESPTALMNLHRVRVVATGQAASSGAAVGLQGLKQDFWDVDIDRNGGQCVIDPRNVRLRRAVSDQPIRLRAYGPANAPSTIVEFAAGSDMARLDPAAFPIHDGSTMTVAEEKSGVTMGQISFAILPATFRDRQSLVAALRTRGCSAQLGKLERMMP
jgi:hypothetical protein